MLPVPGKRGGHKECQRFYFRTPERSMLGIEPVTLQLVSKHSFAQQTTPTKPWVKHFLWAFK